MALHFRVAFLGFSDFERNALTSYFRLALGHKPRYEPVQMLTDADFLVADADHGPSVQLVMATERQAETVFIGTQQPEGAVAFVRRPIDALHVMRELDAMVALEAAAIERPAAEAALPQAPEPSEPLVLREIETPAAPPAEPVVQGPSLFERAAASTAPPPAEATVAADPPATPPETAKTPVAASAQPAPRALIVDDSVVAQRFLESRLRPWGLLVDCVADSAAALERMSRQSYDLVFLDVELGADSELDGLALCQHLKHSAIAMSAAVVLVSAHHSELDRVRGALAGCDAYLAKPLNAIELERLLLRQGLRSTLGPRKGQARTQRV